MREPGLGHVGYYSPRLVARARAKAAQMRQSETAFWVETFNAARGRSREHALEQVKRCAIGLEQTWCNAALAMLAVFAERRDAWDLRPECCPQCRSGRAAIVAHPTSAGPVLHCNGCGFDISLPLAGLGPVFR